MIYITVPLPPMYHQMTWEELFYGSYTGPAVIAANETNTKTYVRPSVTDSFIQVDVQSLIRDLREFNQLTEPLRAVPRESLYHTYYIPKEKGGFRRIDEPSPDLMTALRTLKLLFEARVFAKYRLAPYHTAAFAYVHGRCPKDAVQRHQKNESRWFAKLDLSNFFGSTTLDFTLRQLAMIYPFSSVVRDPEGAEELRKAVELGFLNGGLPQGTPLSPMLTNLVMLPIDFALYNRLRSYQNQRYVYTRYADDFIISSRYDFKIERITELLQSVLAEFHAPYQVKPEKTHYGSSSGQNWILGVMLNKDNEITVGYKRKRQFKSMLVNYLASKSNGITPELGALQQIVGLYSYYHDVEPATIDAMVGSIDKKFGSDVIGMIKWDIAHIA